MKVCIPTEDDNGLEAHVSHHFGMAPYFALVDSETRETQFVLNSAPGHQNGRCRAVDVVAGHHPDAVLTAEIGPGAFEELTASGTAIYRTSDTRLEHALASFAGGGAEQITRDQARGHHHEREGAHHHGGMHGGGGPGHHRAGR